MKSEDPTIQKEFNQLKKNVSANASKQQIEASKQENIKQATNRRRVIAGRLLGAKLIMKLASKLSKLEKKRKN